MISILVPVVSSEHLPNLMPSLALEISRVGGEIIICVNGNHRQNMNFLSQYKNVKTIVNKKPMSFSESNNTMAKHAKYEHILLLNDDTKVEIGTISNMMKQFSLSVGIVGCKIKTWNGNGIQHAGIMFNSDGYPLEIRHEMSNHPDADRVKEVEAVTGCCLMTSLSLWNRVRGLDTRFVNGWEDNDFNLRVRELGRSVIYTGKACIRHRHFGSKDFGRMTHEDQNVALYKKIWIDTGRFAKLIRP